MVEKKTLSYDDLEDTKIYQATIYHKVIVRKIEKNTLNQRYLEVIESQWGDYFTVDEKDRIEMDDETKFKVVFKEVSEDTRNYWLKREEETEAMWKEFHSPEHQAELEKRVEALQEKIKEMESKKNNG